MKPCLKIDDYGFDVYLKNQNLYPAIFDSYKNTYEMNGKIVSGLIMNLLEKTWITKDILYRVAQEIQRKFPELKVDWFETFRIVEREVTLKSAYNSKRAKEGKKPLDEDLKEWVDFRFREYESPEAEIKNIVEQRLKEYKIISN